MTYGHAVRLYPFDWLILGHSSLMIMFITLLGLASVLVVWKHYPRWSRSTVTHFDRKELKAEYVS